MSPPFPSSSRPSEISYSALLCAIDALSDTVPLPYGARIAFLNSVAETTSLTPGTDKIRKCCGMIMELCPSLFIEEDAAPKRETKRESSSCMFDDDGRLMPEPSDSLSRTLVLPARAALVRQSVSASRLMPTKRWTRLVLASVLVHRPLARLRKCIATGGGTQNCCLGGRVRRNVYH